MASSSSMENEGVAVAPAPSLMRSEDYFKTPETLTPTELIFGAMRFADAPTPRHQSAVLQLLLALDAHVRSRDLGQMWVAPLDVVLDQRRDLIVQPDLFFISNERAFIVRDRVRGAPDLVIEVLSPNPRIGSTEERLQWFAEYSVRECWLLHQDHRSLTVVRFAGQRIAARDVYQRRDSIASGVLPEFTSCVDDILL
jgi:Uma2 family endonuclease